MKRFTFAIFLFIIWWPSSFSSIDENQIYVDLELKTMHQESTIEENDLHADKYVITNDNVDYSQGLFYTEEL
jgi:predicted RNA-binding protein associated with RNAse of E/G family